MQIEAIYQNGRLIFDKPIKLKKNSLRVTIIIPDDEIESSDKQKESGIGAELDRILGPFRGEREKVSPEDDRIVWHRHLEEKYYPK